MARVQGRLRLHDRGFDGDLRLAVHAVHVNRLAILIVDGDADLHAFFVRFLDASLGDGFGGNVLEAESGRARPVDTSVGSFVFELTGATEKLDAFIEALDRSAILETVRTGVCGIARGERVLRV